MTPACSIRISYRIIILILFANFLFFDQSFAQIVVNPNDCETFSASYITEDASCLNNQDGKATLQISPVGTNPLPALEELSFKWSLASIENIPSPVELGVGEYSVTITYAALSCSLIVNNILIKAPAPLAINCLVVNDVSTPGGQDGLAKVDCSNGALPYTINWSGPVSGNLVANAPGLNTLNNLQAGNYSVTVTDNCGPMQTCSFTIKEPAPPPPCNDLVSVETMNPICDGITNGFISFTPNPAYDDRTFSYRWLPEGNSSSESLRSLPPGSYTVIVTDNTGCIDTITRTLIASFPLIIEIDHITPDDLLEPGGQGQIQARVINGEPTYDILWTGPPSGAMSLISTSNFIIPNLERSDYRIEVRDSRGCLGVSNVSVPGRFVFEANQDYVIDNTQVREADMDQILPFMDTLRLNGAILVDTCHCESGPWLLQYWQIGPADIIILENTPPQGVQASTKSDDNGWFESFTTPSGEETLQDDDLGSCSYVPDQNTGADYIVKVAIIDSGANLRYRDSNQSGHPLLKGLDWVNSDADDQMNCILNDFHGYDFINKTPVVVDNIGHGTHIAGSIANAFPGNLDLQIMNLKVYDKEKAGNVFNVACAVHYAVSHKAQIINMSLGYYNKYPFQPLYNALKRAESKGILVVLSAGNDTLNIDSLISTNSLRWPASFKLPVKIPSGELLPPLKNLLVVASSHEPGGRFMTADYSNWGETLVDIATNGTNSSTHLDTMASVTLKGTSMATANVSREAAVVLAYKPGMSVADLIIAMHKSDTLFQGDPTRGVYADGILDVLTLYENVAIDIRENEVWRPPVHPANGVRLPLRLNSNTPAIGPEYYIRLGNGRIYYDDVEIVITSSPSLDTVYQAKFCSTNSITWYGQNNEGVRIADVGDTYFIRVTINGRPTSPTIITVVVDD